jgi:hypothetical protein
VEVSRFDVQKEVGNCGATLVDRVCEHRSRNPYRSEVVKCREEIHCEDVGARLAALTSVTRSECARELHASRTPQFRLLLLHS